MIRKIILPLIAIVLLSSCASKFSLVKRKYNKGYHFDISHNKSNAKQDGLAGVKEKASKKTVAQEEPAVSETAVLVRADVAETKPNTAQPLSAQAPKQDNKALVASADKKATVHPVSFKPLKLQAVKALKEAKKGGDSDVNLIIMVILCLFPFINLIPVYLHDGKSVTLNFWLTLILDILFFLPGIIFALLVVLDVVNLA
jgi:hypothetical protein